MLLFGGEPFETENRRPPLWKSHVWPRLPSTPTFSRPSPLHRHSLLFLTDMRQKVFASECITQSETGWRHDRQEALCTFVCCHSWSRYDMRCVMMGAGFPLYPHPRTCAAIQVKKKITFWLVKLKIKITSSHCCITAQSSNINSFHKHLLEDGFCCSAVHVHAEWRRTHWNYW